MSSEPILPSMFHRRLALLLALGVVAGVPLLARLGQLTVTKADQARLDAEARLVKRQWTPTLRGRILDRKGRVLAQDRPAYSIAVDYRVIRGDWAAQRAREFASDTFAGDWRKLGDDDQKKVLAAFGAVYQRHLDDAWSQLARVCNTDPAAIAEHRRAVLARVESMRAEIYRSREEAELKSLAERRATLTPRSEREMDARIRRPFVEEQAPHVLVADVGDRVGFAASLLADEEVPLELTLPEGIPSLAARSAEPLIDRVPRIPGLSVEESGDRDHPFDETIVIVDRRTFPSPARSEEPLEVRVEGVASHVLGWMRRGAQKEDLDGRTARLASDAAFRIRVSTPEGTDRGAYSPDERVGRTGIESSYEDDLRGLRGLRSRRLDTGDETSVDAAPGRDVTLTIDAALQARIQAVMSPEAGLAVVQPWHRKASDEENPTMPDGTPLNGAAVVLDVDTREVLAMVSMPSFSRSTLRQHPELVFDEVNSAYINRAIAKPYTPGSIVKPLILCGSAQRGNFRQGQAIECTGHLLPNNPNMLRCWIYKGWGITHTAQLGHALSAPEGIEVSCNIFFFTLGQRLGVEGILETYREFGVGSRFGLGVGVEYEGGLGAKKDASDVKSWDAVQMAIGQGKVTWTPLHAADAYATIASGGRRIAPRVVRAIGSTSVPPREQTSLEIPSWALRDSLEGLRRSVNEELGTGHHLVVNDQHELTFNVPGIKVWGKTGTAAAPDQTLKIEQADGEDASDDATPAKASPTPGRRVIRSGDHSWYVVLVGRDRPKYAVAVVMEYGGSGGKVSGPIANQIVHALLAEGYF